MPPGDVLAEPAAPMLIWSTCPGVTLSVAVTEPPRPPCAVPGYEPPCAPISLNVATVTPAGTVNVSEPGTLYVHDEAPPMPDFPQCAEVVVLAPGVAAADAALEPMKSVPP